MECTHSKAIYNSCYEDSQNEMEREGTCALRNRVNVSMHVHIHKASHLLSWFMIDKTQSGVSLYLSSELFSYLNTKPEIFNRTSVRLDGVAAMLLEEDKN